MSVNSSRFLSVFACVGRGPLCVPCLLIVRAGPARRVLDASIPFSWDCAVRYDAG